MLGHLASLIKPRIVALLCVTGVAAAFAAGGGAPQTLAAFLLAGAAIAGGSAALNCYYDRDLDRHMVRTAAAAVRAFFASNTFLAAVFAGWAASGVLDPSAAAITGVALVVFALFAWVGNARLALNGVAAGPDPIVALVSDDNSEEPSPATIEDPAKPPLRPDGGSAKAEDSTGDADDALGSPLAAIGGALGSAWRTLRSVYYANSVSWRVFKSGGLVFLGFFCWAGSNIVLSYRPGWTPLYLTLAYGFLLVLYGPIHHLVVIPLSFRLRRRPDALSRVGRRLPTAMLAAFFLGVALFALNPVGPMLIDFTAALSSATGADVDPALLCTQGGEAGQAAVHCHLDSSEGIARVVVESAGEQIHVDESPPFDFTLEESELGSVTDGKRFTVRLEDEDGNLLRQYTRSLAMIDDGAIGH